MLDKYDKEIFQKCMPFLGTHPVIFDVGACKGEYTDYVLSKKPGAKCFLFEPNPELFEGLRHRSKYRMALSDTTGRVDFYLCSGKHNELSSIYEREVFKQTGSELVTVNSKTVDGFCSDNHISLIDFLKIDVEGAEFLVLKGAQTMMLQKKIRFIQVEYGGTYIDSGVKFAEIIKYSGELGYKVYESGKQIIWSGFKEDYRYALFLLTHTNIYDT